MVKVRACDEGLDLNTLYEIEKLILNKCSWRINMTTPIEIINIILTINGIVNMSEFRDTVQNWMNFCLFDYDIYQKYDHFTLSAASILITCTYMQEDSTYTTEILDNLLLDKDNIENCMAFILMKFNDDSGENLDQMYEETSIASLDETRETIDSRKNSYAYSNISRASSYSVVNALDQIPLNGFNPIIPCEDMINGILVESNCVSGKGRKKIKNIKLKRLNSDKGKIKKNNKNKKLKYFFERRMKYSRRVKK